MYITTVTGLQKQYSYPHHHDSDENRPRITSNDEFVQQMMNGGFSLEGLKDPNVSNVEKATSLALLGLSVDLSQGWQHISATLSGMPIPESILPKVERTFPRDRYTVSISKDGKYLTIIDRQSQA